MHEAYDYNWNSANDNGAKQCLPVLMGARRTAMEKMDGAGHSLPAAPSLESQADILTSINQLTMTNWLG